MGVIFVVAEAVKRGFYNGHPDWSNLGQGQPEPGEMPGAPPRIDQVEIMPGDHAYGPLEGIDELRRAVADDYNRRFRQGKQSQYGPENVAIAQGGRLCLTRAMAALDDVVVGYQLPDYTAYEDMFNTHLARLDPFAVRTREEDGFLLTKAVFKQAVHDSNMKAFVVSTPCNPTGNLVAGDDLAALLSIARKHDVTMLMDEFYSHFIFEPGADGTTTPGNAPVSSAAFVEDVNEDPVLIFDGLTKNHRYPGWRIGWVLGPPEMVEGLARTASAIDGGPSRIAQRAALAALEQGRADHETQALRNEFNKKRNIMVERLKGMGIRFAAEPTSTFYCWACLDQLPAPFNNAMDFFWRALDRKVMTVPGAFFDVNPGKLRPRA
jgi:aspartate/methionine/tyrosine aminotransferase